MTNRFRITLDDFTFLGNIEMETNQTSELIANGVDFFITFPRPISRNKIFKIIGTEKKREEVKFGMYGLNLPKTVLIPGIHDAVLCNSFITAYTEVFEGYLSEISIRTDGIIYKY